MRNILFLAASNTLCSCQMILKGALGIEEPQIQKNAAIKEYAAIHYPGYRTYRVDSTEMNGLLRQAYKPNWEVGFRPIQFICFDPDGKIVAQWASCEGSLKYTLSTYPAKSKYISDTTKRFHNFVKGIHPIDNFQKALIQNNKKYTYLVYWTIWTNQQSINLVKSLTEYVVKNGGDKADIILVNIDNYSVSP